MKLFLPTFINFQITSLIKQLIEFLSFTVARQIMRNFRSIDLFSGRIQSDERKQAVIVRFFLIKAVSRAITL